MREADLGQRSQTRQCLTCKNKGCIGHCRFAKPIPKRAPMPLRGVLDKATTLPRLYRSPIDSTGKVHRAVLNGTRQSVKRRRPVRWIAPRPIRKRDHRVGDRHDAVRESRRWCAKSRIPARVRTWFPIAAKRESRDQTSTKLKHSRDGKYQLCAADLLLLFRRNRRKREPAPDVPNAIAPGMLSWISVPAPGRLHTSSFPPMRSARSRIPARP